MIIVEGPDGVGKTTLCKKLLSFLPTHIYSHFTRLPRGFDYHWGYTDRISPDIVQDRFHLSELAYAVARGETPNLDEWSYKLVDARLRLAGGFTIVITADQDLIKNRWDESQMYNLDRTLRAADQYMELVHRSPPRWIDIDMTFHCTTEKAYVTDHEVRDIVERYQANRLRLKTVARERPYRL
jgi:thymidylate kinase